MVILRAPHGPGERPGGLGSQRNARRAGNPSRGRRPLGRVGHGDDPHRRDGNGCVRRNAEPPPPDPSDESMAGLRRGRSGEGCDRHGFAVHQIDQDRNRGSDSNGEKNNDLGPRPRFHRALPSRNPSVMGSFEKDDSRAVDENQNPRKSHAVRPVKPLALLKRILCESPFQRKIGGFFSVAIRSP